MTSSVAGSNLGHLSRLEQRSLELHAVNLVDVFVDVRNTYVTDGTDDL